MQSASDADDATKSKGSEAEDGLDGGRDSNIVHGHVFGNITTSDNARVHLGDNHYGGEGPSEHKVMTALVFSGMDTRRATIAPPQGRTCQWFLDSREYRSWRDNSLFAEHHGFLWIRGKPGAGKSTLMNLAVNHAETHFPDDLAISFFFDASGSTLQRSVEGMYRSLLYQLFNKRPELERAIKQSTWDRRTWSIATLGQHFRDCVLQLGSTKLTCYIDALDECSESDLPDMVSFFEDLGASAVSQKVQVHICFASRHDPRINMPKAVHLTLENMYRHRADIEIYVQAKLRVSNSALLDELVKRISVKSGGSFLWVVFLVRILNEESDRGRHSHSLLAHLDTVPHDLQDLFERALLMAEPKGYQHLFPTLLWILSAWRPLTPFELCHAVLHASRRIGAEALDQSLSPDQAEKFIVNVSKGLVEFTASSPGSKDSHARFIHGSVNDYLLISGLGKLDSSFHKDPSGSSHETLKAWCLEYVSLAGQKIPQLQQPVKAGSDASNTPQKQLLDKFPFLSYAVRGLVIHAELAQNSGITQASFVETFPLDLVIELSNLVLQGDKQHVPFPRSTSAADLFAHLNASELLQLERGREENGSRQHERPELTDSVPDLTMGSSDRFDSADSYDDTDSIRTDNEDNNIRSKERSSYSKVFASELKAGLDKFLHSKHCDRNARARMSAALPNLLKSYALLLARRARPGFEKQTITFIRHRRNGVAEYFHNGIITMPTQAGVPGLHEKMELLSNVFHFDVQDHDPMPDLTQIDPEDPDMSPTDIGLVSPEKDALFEYEIEKSIDIIGETKIRLAREFMIEGGNDFQWLLLRLENAAGLMTTGTIETDTRNELVKLIGSNLEFTLDLDWDPVEFMSEQYRLYNATECRLQEVICLCGAGDNVQALSCEGYTSQMWPHFGPALLDLTSQALEAAAGTYEGSLQGDSPVEIGITFTRSGTNIKLRGDTPALVESSTFFVWLSAVVRAAPQEDLAYSTPEIQGAGAAGCRVTHSFSQPSSDLSQTCWHGMFRNPVIAHGYPIAPRSIEEQGLEMPFSMMAILAQTPFATCFEGATMLKGFSTILSLAKRAGTSFTWHFLVDQQRKRMPYSDGLKVTELQQEVGLHDLQMGRHFVGWTPSVDMLAGTAEVNYQIGPTNQFPSEPSLVSIGSVAVGLSKIVSLGINFVPGKKDIPEALHDMRPAEERIVAAMDWTVLFYDISTRQAWLIDGPSALLHICRAWLESDHAVHLFANLGSPVSPISIFQHRTAGCGMSEAVRLLLDERNRNIELYKVNKKTVVESTTEHLTKHQKVEEKVTASWQTWGDIVEARVLDLEHLHDHQVVQRSKRTLEVHSPIRQQRMDGYDFQEVMKDKPTFQKWEAQFKSSFGGWLDFVESCNAIPIFGADFGDLLRPATIHSSGHQTCQQRGLLPQGSDYMAASMEVLHRLTKSHLKDDSHCVKLGSSTYWSDPGAAFTPCTCDQLSCHMPIARLASIEPKPASRSPSLKQIFTANERGAVIFPCTANKLQNQRPQERSRRSVSSRFFPQIALSSDDRQLSQHGQCLALSQDVEDAGAGAQPEDDDALNGPPNQNVQTSGRSEYPWYKARDSVLPLVPSALRTAVRAAIDVEVAGSSSAVQHQSSCDPMREEENEEYISLAADLEIIDRSGASSKDARQQPLLRKRKASQGLREQAKAVRK